MKTRPNCHFLFFSLIFFINYRTQAYAGPFFGPYRIPVGLLCQLLDQQRLRVSHVEISPGFLENKQPDVERWIGKRNVDAFAGIFLDRSQWLGGGLVGWPSFFFVFAI